MSPIERALVERKLGQLVERLLHLERYAEEGWEAYEASFERRKAADRPSEVFSCDLTWRGSCASTGRHRTDRQVHAHLLDRTSNQPPARFLSAAAPAGILCSMTVKARVQRGRLVVDEPTDLPEGTEIELLPLDPGDWLSDEDRSALHRALVASDADAEAGNVIDPDEVLRELRSE